MRIWHSRTTVTESESHRDDGGPAITIIMQPHDAWSWHLAEQTIEHENIFDSTDLLFKCVECKLMSIFLPG